MEGKPNCNCKASYLTLHLQNPPTDIKFASGQDALAPGNSNPTLRNIYFDLIHLAVARAGSGGTGVGTPGDYSIPHWRVFDQNGILTVATSIAIHPGCGLNATPASLFQPLQASAHTASLETIHNAFQTNPAIWQSIGTTLGSDQIEPPLAIRSNADAIYDCSSGTCSGTNPFPNTYQGVDSKTTPYWVWIIVAAAAVVLIGLVAIICVCCCYHNKGCCWDPEI